MEIIQQICDIILPENFDPARYFLNLLIAIVSILIVTSILRLCFGKASIFNSAIYSALAILCIYAITVLIYALGDNLDIIFSPLPFVSVSEENLVIFPIQDASFREICREYVNMTILAYLMNLLETWLPKGNKVWDWFGFRFFALVLAVCLHYCFNIFLHTVFQESILLLAPLGLLAIVMVSFLLAYIKIMAGDKAGFLGPFLGMFHNFFFNKDQGKQLRRAMLTSLLLLVVVYVLNYLSYSTISLATVAIIAYLPVIFFGLTLWYIVAKFL